MKDPFGGGIVNIDMKSVNYDTLGDIGITTLYLIATGPIETEAPFPVVTTLAADTITQHSALLHGSVFTNGVDSTIAWFEYGTVPGVYNFGTSPVSIPNDSLPVAITSFVTSLDAGTTYRFRLAALNLNGTAHGEALQFTTAAEPTGDLQVTTEPPTNVTQSSAQLNATISDLQGVPSSAYFEWGTTTEYGNSTDLIQLSGTSYPVDIFATISGLTAARTYHYRVRGEDSLGSVAFGFDQEFTTTSSVIFGYTIADEITNHSAKIEAVVQIVDSGAATSVYLEWGSSPDFFDHQLPPIEITGDTSQRLLVIPLDRLKPATFYYYRLVATNASGLVNAGSWFLTSGISDSLQFRIPLLLQDGLQLNDVSFGLNPAATFCIDWGLDEREYPPPPPLGILYARFIDPRIGDGNCYGQGLKLNLLHYSSSSQTDTFEVAFQPGVAGYPVTVRWHDVASHFTGSVALQDIFGGSFLNVDMKAQDSVVIANEGIDRFKIITNAPAFEPLVFPFAETWGKEDVTPTSARLNGRFYSNGDSSVAYIEWGLSEEFGMRTAGIPLSMTDPQLVGFDIDSLMPGTTYYYRAAVKGTMGTSYGLSRFFATPFGMPLDHFAIPLGYSDSAGRADTIWFGVHPQATACLDTVLGESELPPPQSGKIDVRFVGGYCLGNGVKKDLHPVFSSGQTDYYHGHFQADSGKHYLLLTWPDLTWYYNGSVTLRYRIINELPTEIDMLVYHEASIPTAMVSEFEIEAQSPRVTIPPPPPPVDSTIVGHWTFESDIDTFAIDSSPFHNDGHIHGTSLIEGPSGFARHFNGTSDYIEVANSASLIFDPNQSFTISAWFKADSGSSQTIVTHRGYVGFGLSLENGHVSGMVDYETFPYSHAITVTSDTTYNDGLWHFVVFSRARSVCKLELIIDEHLAAPLVQDDSSSYFAHSKSFPLHIGSNGTGSFFNGDLDEIQIRRREAQLPRPNIPAPTIIAVRDVPNDHGKKVFVTWWASNLQGNGETPVTHYSVWRQDSAWTFVGDVPARNDSIYNFVAPTIFDSSIVDGMHLSWFQVTAHTENPLSFYTSESMAGYSLDNLAPHKPDGLTITTASNTVSLHWNPPADEDFQYFVIYRSDPRRMPPFPVFMRLATTTTNEFVDRLDQMWPYSYRISAVDFSGNESQPSPVVNAVLGVDEVKALPTVFALHQNYPNPFNPSTNIQFDLPSSASVMLKIYNILGEEVSTLVNSDVSAGFHSITWNAGNYPSGVYQYRITAIPKDAGAKTFVQTYRMLLIK